MILAPIQRQNATIMSITIVQSYLIKSVKIGIILRSHKLWSTTEDIEELARILVGIINQ